MKKLFVPYEIAILAKEKGFNEGCFTYFFNESLEGVRGFGVRNDLYNWEGNNKIIAPLYQQLVDWFSNKHNIEIQLKRDDDEYFTIEVKKYGECSFTDNVGYQLEFSTCESKDRYESYNIAFEEAFKLI